MSGNEGILSLGSGVSRESGKIKRGSAGEGEMGEGGETWMRKTEENYNHAWCFANTVTGFLGFKMIHFHILV